MGSRVAAFFTIQMLATRTVFVYEEIVVWDGLGSG